MEIWRQALDNYPSNWGSNLNDFISYNNGSDMIISKAEGNFCLQLQSGFSSILNELSFDTSELSIASICSPSRLMEFFIKTITKIWGARREISEDLWNQI